MCVRACVRACEYACVSVCVSVCDTRVAENAESNNPALVKGKCKRARGTLLPVKITCCKTEKTRKDAKMSCQKLPLGQRRSSGQGLLCFIIIVAAGH